MNKIESLKEKYRKLCGYTEEQVGYKWLGDLVDETVSITKQEWQGEWVNVEDRLPEAGGNYLFRWIGRPLTAGTCKGERIKETILGKLKWKQKEDTLEFLPYVYYSGMEYEIKEFITHWMPLPTPPQER